MIQRRVYEILLRLHPVAFRERFGDKMLWIFDETIAQDGPWLLWADATFSLLRQQMATYSVAESSPRQFQAAPAIMVSAARLIQAGIIASIVTVGFFQLLQQQSVPLPQPPRTLEIRMYSQDVCSERKPAPIRTGRKQAF
jgi:hypothetical protein